MSIRSLLLALAAFAVLAAWVAWPGRPVAGSPAMRSPLPVLPQASPRLVVAQPAAVAAASTPAPACEPSAPLGAHERGMVQQRVLATLSSGPPGDQVLALLLQRPTADDAAALTPWAAQVRQAALQSQDALALRWAGSACADPVCRRELLLARLQLEPDNALHWLAWLDESQAASDEAWQGLAAARYWREQPQAAAERIGRALPPGLPAAQREALLQPWLGQDWAAPVAPAAVLSVMCGHYGPGHPVGAACAHAAALMLEAGDSRAGWQQGAELARQLGRVDLPRPALAAPAAATGCAANQSSP